jgi:hypothetical protein
MLINLNHQKTFVKCFLKMFWEAMSFEDGKRTILLREAGVQEFVTEDV